MIKLKKRTIIIILVIVTLCVAWYFWGQQKKAEIEEQKKLDMMHTVSRGNIEVNVKVIAEAELADEQNLSFGKEGKITNVYVKVGAQVKAGEILAELSMEDYDNSLRASELELENANIGLSKLINNDTSLRESQLRSQKKETNSSYKIEIEKKQVLASQLENIKQQKNDLLNKMLRDYDLMKKDLELAKSGLDIDKQTETEQTENTLIARNETVSSILSTLNSSLGTAEQIVKSVDKIFGVTEDFKNESDDYDDFLGAKDKTLLNKTKTKINESYALVRKYSNEIESINSDMLDNEIYEIIRNYYDETILLEDLCDFALDSIDKSIESAGDLTSTMIDGFTATVTSSRSSTIALRTSLETLSSSVNNLLSAALKEDQLQLSLEQKDLSYEQKVALFDTMEENLRSLVLENRNLEKDHKNQLDRKQSQIDTIYANIDLLNKELKDLLDGADKYDLAQLRNLIKQAGIRLERTKDTKDDYQIIAELDGRVRSVGIVEGEQYELDDRKFIVIENPNMIELELQIGQVDIVKIKKGDPVTITFDSHPNTEIKSIISSRDVNPEPNGRGGIYYKANIFLEKQELEILAGMSAIVNIQTEKVDDVLIVPTLALFSENEKDYVYKLIGEKYEKHEVTVGVMNNFQAEIIQGLTKGDIILASVLDEEAMKEMGIDDGSDSPFGNN